MDKTKTNMYIKFFINILRMRAKLRIYNGLKKTIILTKIKL